jgi:serine/threonine protein kinase
MNNPSSDGPVRSEDPASAEFCQQLLDLFEALVDLPVEQREARLIEACADAPELERALRALLARDAETGRLHAGLADQVAPLLREALPSFGADPEQIGPYRVLRRLGEGGMGRVYLARRSDNEIAPEVAIKLVRSDRVSPGLVEKFEAERRHLAALDHPGICRFIDAARLPNGNPYVVMEAVDGEPILDYCARHGLGIAARLGLLRKLLAAVAHAHDRLLVHRDIKPQNVLVTAEGEPKLLDFGIAKSLQADAASLTRTAERFFTPNASAPEQLLGGAIGVGCDVYALGALAYELLSGQLPFSFEGLRAAEIERLILQVAPPPMSERADAGLKRELRGDLDAIVSTCLRKAPAERYANVSALDSDLQRFEEGRPVQARPQNWRYRSRLFVRRHRVAMGLSAALAVAVLGSATALGLQALEVRDQRNLAVIERDRALQVVEILESAFRNADPAQAAGDTVTARQILDAAVPSINALETTQPQVFARMAATLARVELDLVQNARALQWVERGLAATKTEPPPREIMLSLLFVGAMGHAREGDSTKAAPMLELLREAGGAGSPEYYLAQARVALGMSDWRTAATILEGAVVSLSDTSAESAIANELRWLLSSALQRGKLYSAERVALESMFEWQLLSLGESHPWVLQTRMRLIRSQARTAESLDNAAKLFEKLIIDISRVYGEESSFTASTRGQFGLMFFEGGRLQLSIRQLRIAFNSLKKLYGFQHIRTLRTGLNLSYVLRERGTERSLSESEEIIQSVLRASVEEFGYEASLSSYAYTQFVKTLLKQGRFNEALALAVSSEFEGTISTNSLSSLRAQLDALNDATKSARCGISDSIDSQCALASDRVMRIRSAIEKLEIVVN